MIKPIPRTPESTFAASKLYMMNCLDAKHRILYLQDSPLDAFLAIFRIFRSPMQPEKPP